MAWTQTDLDTINAAIATGAKRVRFQTHEVEYQSLKDMLTARDLIKAEVLGADDRGGAIFVEYGGGY
ncbi:MULTISPECIES: hypothetical protein [Rhizobium]|uniref:Uncharacterized protein n=1 Tax=Rhizobium altiplani TaxID=1864509 RepID=A0A109J4E9_9HYPH|nr:MULTISPECIES: hypothetical protein [Rhizobium]KWV42120.1 hypothetical protein AS026_21160 [Rhizobium altiplani]MBD9445769.1 hypothetical protein [Rhizobium sp. RHZ01]NMN73870.1 hypothetical protein [Rhizobium sp. 57MFTsu3.2]